jgi:hypothetical protein
MVLFDRAEAGGYRAPDMGMVRAVDAAHRGDVDATVRHLEALLAGAPLFPVDREFTSNLPPPEILESEPVQALFARIRAERVAVLAQVRAAFPEAP